MPGTITPHNIRAETEELLASLPDREALTAYVYSWVSDATWDLECPESVGSPNLTQYAELLTVISDKWKTYWESLSREDKAARKERVTNLLNQGFTLDGLLLAALSGGQSIHCVVQKAEILVSGNW